MKKVLCLQMALFLGSASFQALAQERLESDGGFTIGVQQTDVSPDSAKFNEYRDIRDGFYLYDFWFDVIDSRSARFMDFRGRNLIRDDQAINFRFGEFGRWSFEIDRTEIPKRISNEAMSPFIYHGDGLFTTPGQVSIVGEQPVNNPATGTPSLVPTAAEMAVNDALVAAWLPGNLRPVELGTQRNRTAGVLNFSFLERLNFRLLYADERKDGSKITYGPLGDRPPRTQNIQLPEPIDFRTRELGFDTEYAGAGFQAHLRYLFSTFDNETETMRWENIFLTPVAGADFATTINTGGAAGDRNVSAFGQRSLAPDNYAHNLSLSSGIAMPMNGRLAGTVAYGWMRQNETLLPYSFSNLGLDWNDPNKLPRQKADAEMRTTRADLDYTFNPLDRLNLRAFLRYYDLDNRTPTDNWLYVTQDTTSTTGGVGYRNRRSNLAYDYDKLNLGLDVSQYLAFWRTTISLGYEREEIDRDFREADTDENIYKVALRTRPAAWLSLRAGFRHGDREGDGYDFNVTNQSYWYEANQVTRNPGPEPPISDVDDPRFLFANHPDLRKYDVSDRKRDEADLAATLTVLQGLDLTGAYRYRKDDFGSGVNPVAPISGLGELLHPNQDDQVATPGQQLGLLEEKRQTVSVDVQYMPSGRWTVNLFGNRQEIDSTFRGMVFNENQRWFPDNPAIQPITSLGPWTDPARLFDAKLEDRTNTLGVGAGYEIIPGRLRLVSDYTLSRGKVDLDYRGYGTPEVVGVPLTDFAFGFDNPETVRHNQYVLNATLEYQVRQGLVFGLHYLFDRYSIKDWMQEPSGDWVEQVGSEFFLRDTTRDNRWGNRLVNMGSYLGPSYEAHVGSVTMTYRF
jgi:MtrB/PioB family decaheme-associated outer membrane protein